MKRSRRYRECAKKVDPKKLYDLDEAIALIKDLDGAKFDETVELVLHLGIDPKKADQNIRGTIARRRRRRLPGPTRSGHRTSSSASRAAGSISTSQSPCRP